MDDMTGPAFVVLFIGIILGGWAGHSIGKLSGADDQMKKDCATVCHNADHTSRVSNDICYCEIPIAPHGLELIPAGCLWEEHKL